MPVYLIRHGQSEFNAAHSEMGAPDPMIFDAPLTELGHQQASDTREQVRDLGIVQVYTSPLTRAIQTARAIFDGVAPISIIPDHREKLTHSCDVGSPPSALSQRFPDMNFDHLDDIWWHQGPLNADGVPVESPEDFATRIDLFRTKLRDMRDRPMAIVGHGDTFRQLAGFDMENCEVRQYFG